MDAKKASWLCLVGGVVISLTSLGVWYYRQSQQPASSALPETYVGEPIGVVQTFWEGIGVTGAWYVPELKRLNIISKDRYWNIDNGVYVASGHLSALPSTHPWRQGALALGR